jgi:hypothetical protein
MAASLATSSIATTAALRDQVSTYNNAASRANSNALDAANAAACVCSATTTHLAVCLRAQRQGNATCFFVAAVDFTMSCGLSSGSEEDASDEEETLLQNKSYYFISSLMDIISSHHDSTRVTRRSGRSKFMTFQSDANFRKWCLSPTRLRTLRHTKPLSTPLRTGEITLNVHIFILKINLAKSSSCSS